MNIIIIISSRPLLAWTSCNQAQMSMSFWESLPSLSQFCSGCPWLFFWLQHRSCRTRCQLALSCWPHCIQELGLPFCQTSPFVYQDHRIHLKHHLRFVEGFPFRKFGLPSHRRMHFCSNQIMSSVQLRQLRLHLLQRTYILLMEELAVMNLTYINAYFLILVLLSLYSYNLSSSLMLLFAVLNVLSFEWSLELYICLLVNSPRECACTGSVTGFSVSLPVYILALHSWHVPSIS